jgi:tRNA threonylcarbamoyladenosine biosynthesis protein TsaB
MKSLVIETSTELLGILLKTETGSFTITRKAGLSHSEKLLPFIDSIFTEAQINPGDIDLLICSQGPGSFTGLRIGMSAVKGLSFSLNKPFVCVSSLDAIAFGKEYFTGLVLPCIDAKKNKFFCSYYENGKKLTKDLDSTKEDIISCIQEKKVLLTGPDALLLQSVLGPVSDIYIDPLWDAPWLSGLLVLGEQIFHLKGPFPQDASPVYIRKSEAEEGLKL